MAAFTWESQTYEVKHNFFYLSIKWLPDFISGLQLLQRRTQRNDGQDDNKVKYLSNALEKSQREPDAHGSWDSVWAIKEDGSKRQVAFIIRFHWNAESGKVKEHWFHAIPNSTGFHLMTEGSEQQVVILPYTDPAHGMHADVLHFQVQQRPELPQVRALAPQLSSNAELQLDFIYYRPEADPAEKDDLILRLLRMDRNGTPSQQVQLRWPKANKESPIHGSWVTLHINISAQTGGCSITFELDGKSQNMEFHFREANCYIQHGDNVMLLPCKAEAEVNSA